jgi:hypothetical protein
VNPETLMQMPKKEWIAHVKVISAKRKKQEEQLHSSIKVQQIEHNVEKRIAITFSD